MKVDRYVHRGREAFPAELNCLFYDNNNDSEIIEFTKNFDTVKHLTGNFYVPVDDTKLFMNGHYIVVDNKFSDKVLYRVKEEMWFCKTFDEKTLIIMSDPLFKEIYRKELDVDYGIE